MRSIRIQCVFVLVADMTEWTDGRTIVIMNILVTSVWRLATHMRLRLTVFVENIEMRNVLCMMHVLYRYLPNEVRC